MPESPADKSLLSQTRLPLNGTQGARPDPGPRRADRVRHLADWGADVIRIEPPATGGEDVERQRATASTSRTCIATSGR